MWGLFAPVYLGLLATVLAYAIWGDLLQRYSAGTVAPFALLAPAVGLGMSSLVYGELQHHAIGRDGTSANRRGGHCWAA